MDASVAVLVYPDGLTVRNRVAERIILLACRSTCILLSPRIIVPRILRVLANLRTGEYRQAGSIAMIAHARLFVIQNRH